MFRGNLAIRNFRFGPAPTVLRKNKAYMNAEDAAPQTGLMTLLAVGMFAGFVYFWKTAFTMGSGWERASMPSRQERYDRTVWSGGVNNPEMLETTMQSKPHKGPRSLENVRKNRNEVMATRRNDEGEQ